CKFPTLWTGKWFQHGKQGPVMANSTHILDRKCVLRKDDMFLTEENGSEGHCYRCMIFTERHKNVIQYRESYCSLSEIELEDACSQLTSDDALNSLFRLNSKPIACPFAGPFSFSYNRGHGECKALENQVESCTDDSKLLFKYQACADIQGAESSTEELQCLAMWKDGRNMYLVGTLKPGGVSQSNEYRCFLYEKVHHQGKIGYMVSQSGEPSCNGLTSVSEGARTFVFTKEEKEHVRCKYPTWVTQHHDWHFLDGSRNYHFTTGNSTLKVTFNDGLGTGGSGDDSSESSEREEKVVCHNLEKMHPKDDMQGPKVKLVAHITNGCDTGYVCMIFHKRDGNVIEVQQSSQKMIMPHEACSLDDPAKQPFSTLITSTLHKRSCPQPGRYTVLDLPSSSVVQMKLTRRQRRFANRPLSSSSSSPSTWRGEDSNEAGIGPINTSVDDCQNADVQIGCTSSGQNEMIIQESCKRNEIVSAAYSCHGSWEEAGTWYTIVSRNRTIQQGGSAASSGGLGVEKETLCVSMRQSESTRELPNKAGRVEQQELWLSRPQSFCQRGAAVNEWTYKLANQGVCEDLNMEASSSASSSSLARVSAILSLGMTMLCSILAR
ncbi:hypothetical protein QAD02_024237, partial [Eretmocerus hayati]